MATTNEAMVELSQKLTETNQEQGKKIPKLMLQIETLTNLLALNVTRVPLQEEEKEDKTSFKKIRYLYSQLHKRTDYFWELENNAKISPTGWVSNQNK